MDLMRPMSSSGFTPQNLHIWVPGQSRTSAAFSDLVILALINRHLRCGLTKAFNCALQMLIKPMQLDKFTDYGLRVLIYLRVSGERRASVSEIAAKFSLSEHHLSKVATALAAEGFIVSTRGRAGGLSLARAATDIAVGDVVRRLTRNTSVAECFAGNGACMITPSCGLRAPLAQAQEAFFAVLDGYTLEEVTGQGAALRQLLGLKGASTLDEPV